MADNTQTQQQINTLRTLQESYDSLATSVQTISDSWAAMVTNRNSIDGVEFIDSFTPNGVLDVLINRGYIKKIVDTKSTAINSLFYSSGMGNLEWLELRAVSTQINNGNSIRGLGALKTLILPLVPSIGGNGILECNNLEYIYTPSVTSISGGAAIYSLGSCKELHFPNCTSILGGSNNIFGSCHKLILLELGAISSSFSLQSWSPTEALLNNSQTLLTQEDLDNGFTSNLEKLLYNIREHIAANLPVAPNTITFSAAVKAAILADQATSDAFTSKGWTIA